MAAAESRQQGRLAMLVSPTAIGLGWYALTTDLSRGEALGSSDLLGLFASKELRFDFTEPASIEPQTKLGDLNRVPNTHRFV